MLKSGTRIKSIAELAIDRSPQNETKLAFSCCGCLCWSVYTLGNNTTSQYKPLIQICFLTVTVSYFVIGDVWQFRKERGVLSAILAVALAHAIFSFSLWHVLPLHIIPLLAVAVLEGIGALVILYRCVKV